MEVTWLIIGSSLALVVGSIFWILPSPLERKKMQRRQEAVACGFKIRMMNSSEQLQKFGVTASKSGLCYYFKSGFFKQITQQFSQQAVVVITPQIKGQAFTLKVRDESGDWCELPHQISLMYAVEIFECIFVGESEIGVLWSETSSIHDIERIIDETIQLLS